MMDGGGEDHLSALSDDLLRRILHFVPFKEAASTSVLSRRWGSLWRSSGAVNLAVRIHKDEGIKDYVKREDALLSHRDAFVRAAQAALNAADAPVTRLTLRVEDPGGGGVSDQSTYNFFHLRSHDRHYKEHDVVIRVLLSHPAVARVEEFRVAAGKGAGDAASAPSEEECDRYRPNYRLRSLPSKALRVLDIAGCGDLTPPATAAFPLLETLRLRACSVDARDAQALMDAAPRLAAVRLESVFFKGSRSGAARAPCLRLRCRVATELVLEFCGMEGQAMFGDRGSIDIDAPRLRYLRYKGSERRFSLASPAPDMAALELHFVECRYHRRDSRYDEDRTRVLFWQFVRNFAHARALTLRVNRLEDIAVGKARRGELLCTFRNAARLELEGAHHPTSKAAAVAIANLLRCCPAVRDLRLNLSTVPSSAAKHSRYGQPFLRRKDRLDYEKSVGRFMRRGRLLNPVISLDHEDKHGDEVADGVPGLSGHSLTCLQSSLRRVGLQFRLDDPSSFGVRLVKFFTGNANLLEEICVDSGNRKLCEHMNIDIERWIVNASSKVCLKRKNVEESSSEFSEIPSKCPKPTTDLIGLATSFTVLPLER